MAKDQITVIAVGGSLMVPHLSDTDGIDVLFLRAFRKMLLVEVKKGRKFVLVAGGGKTCRVYQSAARKTVHATDYEIDRLGVVSTKLNAALLTAIFGNEAYAEIIHDGMPERDLVKASKSSKKVFIASGGVPGRSTDYVAVKLAEVFQTSNVIIAGDTPFVFEKDPRKFPKAKPLPELTWSQYEKLVPKKWSPGLSSPVDPVATQLAKKLKLQVRLIRGTDMKNFQNAIKGKSFTGTVIR